MFGKKTKSSVYVLELEDVAIQVTRKRIKNLYLRINRHDGTVRVSCPERVSERKLLSYIHTRMDWIRKHRKKAQDRPVKATFTYVEGERHSFKGKEYRLLIRYRKKKMAVQCEDDALTMFVHPDSTQEKRQALMESFYRQHLKEQIPVLIRKYEPLMGVKVEDFGVKRMKTRWGTCNITARRIWLNLELAKLPEGCLEMVVVHEMVHLLERLHSKRFYALMDSFFPEWRDFDTYLNSTVD